MNSIAFTAILRYSFFMAWSVYIIQCRDGSYYSGISQDVNERVRRHNAGTGAKYTKGRRPVTLKFLRICKDHRQAAQIEYHIKTWPPQKKAALISRGWKYYLEQEGTK